ncbi:hypothetical protein [Streptomyces sp. NPDC047981]|uniref:hypothetical protein n=1 Tax=Streptomyces sp. NPDC047981 TaxID=3154610 RepID=UPI0034436BF5
MSGRADATGGVPLGADIEVMMETASIRVVPVHERFWSFYDEDQPYPVVTDESPRALRDVAEEFAMYFKRETPFDGYPYSARPGDNTFPMSVVLIPYRNWVNSPHCPVVGAVGVIPAGNGFWRAESDHLAAVTWVWLHPHFRGKGLMTAAWKFIREQWPTATLTRPFTPAGARLRKAVEGKDTLPGEMAPRRR